MKKRVSVLLTAILLVIAVTVNPMAAAAELSYEEMVLSNTYPTSASVTREIELEKPALEAYYAMLDSFKMQYGEDKYPEDYAGAFITEDNKLCISLVETSLETCELYRNYCGNYDEVLFEQVAYSYEELEEVFDMVMDDASDASFTSAYIDVMENNVKLGINAGTATWGRRGAYENYPVEIVYEQPGETEASTELYGGLALSGYTLGGCGTFQGEDAVVLCGHGLTEGDSIRFESNNRAFAEVVIQQYASDENYDYAVATINSGATVTLSNKVKNNANYTTITSESSYLPAVGSTICSYGKTGGFGVGTVKAISSVLHDNRLGVSCYGLVRCEWNDGQAAPGAGNSGGPIYTGHVFHGTYTGSNDENGIFWFSPIGAVPGFTFKTSS